MKYIISASLVILAMAILIIALMPRYYLLVVFPEKPVIQMGPFATQTACENARHRILQGVYGNASEKETDEMAHIWACVSSR